MEAAAAAGVISDSLANSRTIKPFFSSTFSDFTAEREHLVRGPTPAAVGALKASSLAGSVGLLRPLLLV